MIGLFAISCVEFSESSIWMVKLSEISEGRLGSATLKIPIIRDHNAGVSSVLKHGSCLL